MMIDMLHPLYDLTRRPLRHELPKSYAKVESLHVPGLKESNRAATLKLYEGLSSMEQRQLRAQRAQRALDVIDLFHADLPIVMGSMTEKQRHGMLEIAMMTNKMRHKLRGIVNSENEKSELSGEHEWCKELG